MNILLWKAGALGDVLLTTPLVRQLRRALPQARIEYLTGRSCVPLLEGNPNLDRVIGFDEHILYNARVTRLPEVLAALRGYDQVIVLDKHWIFSLLAAAALAPRRIGFDRRWFEGLLHHVKVPYGPLRHEIHCYLDLLQAAGLPVDRSDLELELPAPQACAISPNCVVLVNSGGVNPNEQSQVRKMPAPLFRDLIGAFDGVAQVVFLGAAGEHAYYEQFASGGAMNLCGKTRLNESWHVLRHAQAVYTTDCGLMHMAGALNRNVTAIFGPTHPARKCPPSARWAWTDQDIYDSSYEVFGRVPTGTYFQRMGLGDILTGSPSASPQGTAP